jgi:hypothetical protein
MPALPTDDNAARRHVQALLAGHWTDMVARLGERAEAFHAAAWQQAARRSLVQFDSAARYLNLCFAFGPSFEERPENEWALAILADDRLAEWLKLHQLVLRAVRELKRRGSEADTLQRADAALLDALDIERRLVDADAAPLPRKACDIDALDLRVLDSEWRHEYRRVDGAWQHMPGPALPAPLRVDAQHPAPAVLTLLSHAAGEGPPARLQVRQILHGGCDGERHPAVRWLDAAGLARWQGHEARATSWPLHALAQPEPGNGLGVALVEETAPAIDLLDVPTCGLRDEGPAIGALRVQVQVFPAHQWLVAVQRGPGVEQAWPRNAAVSPPAPTATRCRIERDGVMRDAAASIRGFDEALPRALAEGFDRLFAAWQQTARAPTMRATPGLLVGRGAIGWGWREGAAGHADAPLMRVLADLQFDCSLDLSLEGETESGGTRAHVQLTANGKETLQFALEREQPRPPLLDSLMPAAVRFRFPFSLRCDPVASADGAIWNDAGPCTGAVTGEAGLRPRVGGGSGWQWFVRMNAEPVLAPITVHDPVLGRTRRTLALLPAIALLDWSLG